MSEYDIVKNEKFADGEILLGTNVEYYPSTPRDFQEDNSIGCALAFDDHWQKANGKRFTDSYGDECDFESLEKCRKCYKKWRRKFKFIPYWLSKRFVIYKKCPQCQNEIICFKSTRNVARNLARPFVEITVCGKCGNTFPENFREENKR